MGGNIENATGLAAQSPEPSMFDGAHRGRILYVEDDSDTREMVTFMLTRQGYEVASAASSAEAIKLAKEGSYDLYILDHCLPDGSGLSLSQRLRAVNAQVPILFCSGWPREKQMMAAADNGAQDYLMKPFTADELLAKISGLLRP